MHVNRIARQVADNLRTFGLGPALRDVCYRATNRVVPVSILEGMTAVVDEVDPAFFDPGPLSTRFATAAELSRAAASGEWGDGMAPGLLDTSLGKGDECVGCFDGDRLVSAGWYARTPTKISDTMRLHFDPRWVYMHHGYTLPEYRGRRLHAIGMAFGLRAFTARGARGLISYVDFNNLPSLRSVERMGYRIFGEILLVAIGGKEMALSTPGCRPYGFRVAPVSA